MARKKTVLDLSAVLALLALVVLLNGEGVAAEESLCRMSERGLIACLPCVTGAAAQPSDRCCAALAKADLPCLCRYKDSPVLPRMGVKPDLAGQLPAKCKLSMPAECS